MSSAPPALWCQSCRTRKGEAFLKHIRFQSEHLLFHLELDAGTVFVRASLRVHTAIGNSWQKQMNAAHVNSASWLGEPWGGLRRLSTEGKSSSSLQGNFGFCFAFTGFCSYRYLKSEQRGNAMKEWVPESAEFIPELDKWLFFNWRENSLESAKGRVASQISPVLRNFCLDFDFANMKAEFCLIWEHRPAGMLLLEGEPGSSFCNWPCSWFILNNRWNTSL